MAVEENAPTLKISAESKRNLLYELYLGTAEQTYFKSPLVPNSYKTPYNQDDLWQKTGDYRIYEEMMQDDQVSVCMSLKKDLVIGSGFDFVSCEEGQEEIVEELNYLFGDGCDFSFSDAINEILSAYEFGFSMTEKVFKAEPDGTLKVKASLTRHPGSFTIHQDAFGYVSKIVQSTDDGEKDVNLKALIHFINNPKFMNPYGTSDLRNCYAAWFAKRQVIRYFAIFLEKASGPIPVASYATGVPDEVRDDIFDAIKRFQAKTALVIPKEIEMEFLESKNTGEAYSRAINIFNMFIGRSLFIPDLLGMTGSETSGGSFSLGTEQIRIFFMHINRRRESVERALNNHWVKPICAYNYGLIGENIPKLKFKPLDDQKAIELAKQWLEAVKGKVWKPNDEEVNYFRKLVKFPEGEVTIQEPTQPTFPGQPGQNQISQRPEDMPMNDQEDMGEGEMDGEDQMDSQEMMQKKKFAKIDELLPGGYHKKVNFKAIETKLDDYDNSVSNTSRQVIKKIYADILDQIQKKKIIQSGKVNRIDSIKVKYLKELKQLLKSSFMELYSDAQSQASSEILKSNFAKPILSDEFLAILEKETFDFIGDWEYKVSQNVRTNLIAAIKDGKPLSAVVDVLDSDGKKLAQDSMDRYARTKHTEVMNKGRLEFFQNSGIVSGYQYSAILDDRTSDICAGLNGKKFAAGTEPIPPMHFNCRSVLIPITKYEEFDATEAIKGQSVNDFIEENKGRGFSTK